MWYTLVRNHWYTFNRNWWYTLDWNSQFTGFIGKGLILIENDLETSKIKIDKMINTLRLNAIADQDGIYWTTRYPFWPSKEYEETLNLGIPHGILGIMLFLIKCQEIYGFDEEINKLLKGSNDWLINKLNKENNQLLYVYYKGTSETGKLGWCYGDLSIAFTLLRYHEVFGSDLGKAKAYQLINQASSKPLNDTGVRYFKEFDIFDVCLCHGTSSIAYMYKKMADITKDKKLYDIANEWLSLTICNLEKLLPQIDAIRQNKDSGADGTMGFLEGLSGVGLVLIAFQDPKLSNWDKLLLLDRPGRE